MLRGEAAERIALRVSGRENLYFPRVQQSEAINPSLRNSLLLDLLSRDIPLFLERYGTLLTNEELNEFDVLQNDYEVNWHLKRLRAILNPTSDDLRSRSMLVKNRRRAYLNKLMRAGQYFSEDAMREREPYLHHEYVGKFQDPTGRSMPRPGERWSETLMRRSEEALLVAEIRREQQRLGVAQSEWLGNETNMEEEEEEEDEDNDEETGAENETGTSGGGQHEGQDISAAELQEMMDQFTHVMQQKFLSGEDKEYMDYSKIDNDETLDDHWLSEANYDAEEKYFGED